MPHPRDNEKETVGGGGGVDDDDENHQGKQQPQPQPNKRRHLLNEVDMSSFMAMFPDVQTFSLCHHRVKEENNKDDSNEGFKAAMQKAVEVLVHKYPVLRGRVLRTNEDGKSKLWVEEDFFSKQVEDYFTIRDLSSSDDAAMVLNAAEPSESLSSSSQQEKVLLDLMRKHIIPICAIPKSIDEVWKTESRLFHVDLVLLNDHYFCFSVKVCHAIADGATYYRLVAEFVNHWSNSGGSSSSSSSSSRDNSMSHQKHPPAKESTSTNWNYPDLQWGNPHIAQSQAFDDPGDRATGCGTPLTVGVLSNLLHNGIFGNNLEFILISQEKLKTMKQTKAEERSNNHVDDDDNKEEDYYLTRNDILTTALCQANQSSTLLITVRNNRTRSSGAPPVGAHEAGSYVSNMVMPTEAARDPHVVRQTVEQGYYYSPGQIPRMPYYRGKFMTISNWASARGGQRIVPDQYAKLKFHCPHTSFVAALPFDLALVFDVDDGNTIGILHNFASHSMTSESRQLLDSLRVSEN